MKGGRRAVGTPQRDAPQGPEASLAGRRQKGIVGNYTGLERASNALIQRDIFIKKEDCWTKRARSPAERPSSSSARPLDEDTSRETSAGDEDGSGCVRCPPFPSLTHTPALEHLDPRWS